MRHAPLFAAIALSACTADSIPPEPAPLRPVQRIADLFWTVDGTLPPGLDPTALEPAAIILGPADAPALNGAADPGFDARLVALELAAPGVPIGITLPPLPADSPTELCFDPISPTTDPFLRARKDALIALLQGDDALRAVVVDPEAGRPVADVSCTCTPCESTGPFGLAQRLSATWTLLSDGAAEGAASTWFWDHAASTTSEPLDIFRSDLHTETTLRLRAGGRGPSSIWTPDAGGIEDGSFRRVAADLDVTAPRFGPIDVPLLDPLDLVDRVRRHRLAGVETWFLQLASGAPGAPAEATMAHGLFLDFNATADELLSRWIAQRWGVDTATVEGEALLLALRGTRRALELATAPLGIAVEGVDLGVPGAGHVAWVEPSDPAWSDRYLGTQAPTLEDMIQGHQWLFEGVALAEADRANLEIAAPLLPDADAAELRRQFSLLSLATRSWARRLDAELALAYGADGVPWALDDADALDGLADEADATPSDTFPVAGATLREAAAWIRESAGPGTAAARTFPLITNVRFDFAEDRTNVRWHVTPSGSGWSERGGAWPDYPDSSSLGDQTASEWTAWVRQLPANTRFTFRACSEVEGVAVCSADNVLWTPQ